MKHQELGKNPSTTLIVEEAKANWEMLKANVNKIFDKNSVLILNEISMEHDDNLTNFDLHSFTIIDINKGRSNSNQLIIGFSLNWKLTGKMFVQFWKDSNTYTCTHWFSCEPEFLGLLKYLKQFFGGEIVVNKIKDTLRIVDNSERDCSTNWLAFAIQRFKDSQEHAKAYNKDYSIAEFTPREVVVSTNIDVLLNRLENIGYKARSIYFIGDKNEEPIYQIVCKTKE